MKVVGKKVARKDGKSYTAYFLVKADGKKKRISKEVAMKKRAALKKAPAKKKMPAKKKAASCTSKYKKCIAAKDASGSNVTSKKVKRKDGKSYTAYFLAGADGKKKRISKELAMKKMGKKMPAKKKAPARKGKTAKKSMKKGPSRKPSKK